MLDVAELVSGLDATLQELEKQINNIQNIKASVNDIISIGDSLKGDGGDAIRSFYEECHIPFLSFYQSLLEDYQRVIKDLYNTLYSFEPASNAVIRENYLQSNLKQGLNKLKALTSDLTSESNELIHSVSDILHLPNISEYSFLSNVSMAENELDKTIEKLNEFDNEQSKALNGIVDDSETALSYVKQVESMFRSKNLSVDGYIPGSLFEQLSQQSTHSSVASTNSNIGSLGASPSSRAMNLLLAYEANKGIEATTNEDEYESLLQAIKDGAMGSLAPLAIFAAVHKTGLLRIEYTKKKNHYTFKYNRKVLHFLKGRIGPKWTKQIIQKMNRTSKANRNIDKKFKSGSYRGVRIPSQKVKGAIWKLTTGNRPLHENVKSKLIKYSSREMVIPKEAFKKVVAKASAIGAGVVGFISGTKNIVSRLEESSHLKGEEIFKARGRMMGEEVNKTAGGVTGAVAGAYVGAAIGGALSGPFAPVGAAVGGIVGSAIGGSVGEWATKYTSKFIGDAGEKVGEVLHAVKDKAKEALDGAKNVFNGATNALFG